MRKDAMRAPILVVMATLAGCASAPGNPEATPVPSPAASAPDTASTAAPSDDTKGAFKPPAGWRAKIVDWEVRYCRKGPVGGSLFSTELCMTEEQLREHMAANDEMRRDKDRSSRVCARDGCSQ
jgi:hypothetical protein